MALSTQECGTSASWRIQRAAAIRDFYRDRPTWTLTLFLKVGMHEDLPIRIASTIGQCSMNWTVDTTAGEEPDATLKFEAACIGPICQLTTPFHRREPCSHWLRGFPYPEILPHPGGGGYTPDTPDRPRGPAPDTLTRTVADLEA